jgi:hypothetical protein
MRAISGQKRLNILKTIMKPNKRETVFNTESYYHSYPTGYAHFRTSFLILQIGMPYMRSFGSLGAKKTRKKP